MKILKAPIKKRKIDPIIANDELGLFETFVSSLKNSNYSLDIFYSKINTLKYERVNISEMFNKTALSEYDVARNILRYDEVYLPYTNTHELFHVSSTVRTKNCIYSGFSQINLKNHTIIGQGLTEGYTCILDERYSNIPASEKHITIDGYLVTKIVVEMLEDLVTKERMEDYYSHADLYSLVQYLSNLSSYEATIRMIKAIDLITKYCDRKKRANVIITLCCYRYILTYIGFCYLEYIIDAYYSREISSLEYEELINYVKTLMNRELQLKNVPFLKSKKISEREFNKMEQKIRKKYTQ